MEKEILTEEVLEHIRQERDIAIGQLNEIGIDLGADMSDVKKAFEKQKPKQPIRINKAYHVKSLGLELIGENTLICPECKSDMLHPGYPCKCGQILDWQGLNTHSQNLTVSN